MSDIKKTIKAIRGVAKKESIGLEGACGCCHEYLMLSDDLRELADGYEALATEVAELREALEHYADKNNWEADRSPLFDLWSASENGYTRAQAALEKHKALGP